MKKRQENHENNERWLLTYSDLITLLMIFFVIMYASSNIDKEKYKKMSESFNSVFGSSDNVLGEGATTDGVGDPVVIPETTEEQQLNDLKTQVDKIISENGFEGEISTRIEERGLVVSFASNVFFDSGKANIRSDMEGDLTQIADIINKLDNFIRVEGNTDNIPIKNDEFKSNWELSSVRASNVVEYLINSGVNAEKLSAVGYGEFRPVSTNDTEDGRSMNRRVDIVVLSSKFSKSETQ